MMFTTLVAMVRKDLLLFFADRRAVIMSFAVPIAIASFFGSIFSGPSNPTETARIPVAVVDLDGSAISRGIVAGAVADKSLMVKQTTADAAREQVRRGDTTAGTAGVPIRCRGLAVHEFPPSPLHAAGARLRLRGDGAGAGGVIKWAARSDVKGRPGREFARTG